MKKNLFVIMMLFIVSSLSMELIAQENLNALIKKYEATPFVDIDYVCVKNPKTKEVEYENFSLTIRESSLVNEFLDALKKDREKATKISESKKGGKLFLIIYEFGDTAYSLRFLI